MARKYYMSRERDHASTQGSHPTRPSRSPDLAANDRMNQILIEHLDPAAGRAKPPGKAGTMAAIFTHIHNVPSKWVRLTAPQMKVPRQLNRAHCTPQQARAGLAESAAGCAEMLSEALGGCGGRIEKFRRDGWARPWPVGLEMLCYRLSHEAHQAFPDSRSRTLPRWATGIRADAPAYTPARHDCLCVLQEL
jgi:hypothetical protein